ncbi:cation:proton antiporter [Pendulispora albinea]|uniref:Cation:proton antiporter n=1 Tax=Pendulispora albinea TaxID=2741071 RepID=A0ABZ2LWM7_9BACT
MIRAVLLLVIVVILIAAARSFLPEETSLVGSGAALAFGFVLLAALQSGTIFASFRLPRLTGYLMCGFIAGPSVLDFVTESMVRDLKLVNGVAIGLIALSAGGELNFKRLRPRLRAIVSVGAVSLLLAILFISTACFLLSSQLPFMAGMSVFHRFVVSLTMGVVLSALSPAVTLALIAETGSSGPISETILGIVVLADLAIVLCFAGANALANAVFGAVDGSAGGGAGELMVHLFGSMGGGAVLGLVLAFYLKTIAQRVALFVFGILFLCAEAGARLHLDPLLMCLTAGLFLENATDIEGAKLVHDIESASMPVFAVFFAVAGAGLHWDVFKRVISVAVVLAIVRAIALLLGSRIGMALGKVPAAHRKIIPYGTLSQSGVAIGLCVLLAKHFAGWGEHASACLLGAVMINELIGPVLFRGALLRSGEAGRREAVAGSH